MQLGTVTPIRLLKTFAVSSPRTSHERRASCAEVECGHYLNGWASPVDTGTELGARQAHYIRAESGRRFKEVATEAATIVRFEFEPGQQCFAEHTVPLERPAVFSIKDGADKPEVVSGGEEWTDRFNDHIDRIKE